MFIAKRVLSASFFGSLLGLCAMISLAPAQAVEGIVYAPDGAPLAHAEVRLEGAVGARGGQRPPLAASATDEAGRFAFAENPPAGPLVVVVWAPGLARTERHLNRSDARVGLRISTQPGRDLRLRIQDSTGTPIEGVRVSRGQSLLAVSDAEGSVWLRGLSLAPQAESLEITASGFIPESTRVPLDAEAFALTLRRGSRVRAYVQDTWGNAVANADVAARLPRAAPYSAAAGMRFRGTTDAKGIAILSGLPPGQPIVLTAAGEGAVTSQSDVFVSPAKEGATLAVCLELTGPQTWQGRIVDGHGHGVAQAELRVRPISHRLAAFGQRAPRTSGGVQEAFADDRGNIRLTGLPAGWLVFEVRAQGFATTCRLLNIGDPDRAVIEQIALFRSHHSPGSFVEWTPSVAAALDRAERDHLPVLISVTMDGERSNDWIAEHHFRDPEVIRHARHLPMLLANAFGPGGIPTPEGVQHAVDAEGMSTRYGTLPPRAFQAVERFARAAFFGAASFTVPTQIVLDPQGREWLRRPYYLSERDLVRLLTRLLRQFAPELALPLARERWRTLRSDLARQPRSARTRLLRLVHGGDEHAVLLLGDLANGGVPASSRLMILQGLVLPAILDPASALQPFLNDPDPTVRSLAVQRLAPIVEREDELRRVAKLLGDRDLDVVFAAQEALAVQDSGVSIAVDRVTDGARWVILEQLIAISQIETLHGIDQVLASSNERAAAAIFAALARRVAGDDQAYEPLIRTALGGGLRGAQAMASLARTPRSAYIDPLEMLEGAWDAPQAFVRVAAAQLAEAWGEEVPERLLEDEDPEVLWAAASATLALRPTHAGAIATLRRCCEWPWLRARAELSLERSAKR